MNQIRDLHVLIDRIPFAEGNIGEEAILASLLQDLQACGVKDISVFSNMPQRTRLRQGDNIIHVIPDKLWRWLLLPFEVSKADLLVWGGGHMLQDRSSRLYIPYVTKALLWARVLGVARFIYAPGMGPVATRLGKMLSRWALRGSERITVRDDASVQLLRSIEIRADFLRTADPAFSLKTQYDQSANSSRNASPIIGFAPRRHFYRRGSWFPVSWQLAARQANPRFDHFLQEAAAALDYLVEKHLARVRLLPMDIGPNPRDDLICHRLRNYMVYSSAAEVLDDDPPLDEFVRRLSELDLLISARLHGVILGLRFGLPFIGIDSDGKIEHFAQSIGYGEFALKDADLNRDRLCDLAQKAFEGGDKLRQDLFRHGAILRNRAEQNREQLKNCLQKIASAR